MDNTEYGFITSALVWGKSKNDKHMLRSAQALAYSIRLFDTQTPLALMVNDLSFISDDEVEMFDYVVEFPFAKNVMNDVRTNDWQLYWASPFEKNIFIDPRTLVTSKIGCFDYFEYSYNVCFMTTDYRFNGLPTTANDGYFIDENKSMPVTSMFYFDKSDKSQSWFKMADPMLQHWRDTYKTIISDKKNVINYYCPSHSASLVTNSLHSAEDFYTSYTPINITNMKVETDSLGKQWNQKFNFWIDDTFKIKIGNYRITNMLYYHHESFITDELYDRYRTEHARRELKQPEMVD